MSHDPLLYGCQGRVEPNLPCPVCGQPCRANIVLRHAENQKPPIQNALGHSINELRQWGGKGETELQQVMLRAARTAEDFFWRVADPSRDVVGTAGTPGASSQPSESAGGVHETGG